MAMKVESASMADGEAIPETYAVATPTPEGKGADRPDLHAESITSIDEEGDPPGSPSTSLVPRYARNAAQACCIRTAWPSVNSNMQSSCV